MQKEHAGRRIFLGGGRRRIHFVGQVAVFGLNHTLGDLHGSEETLLDLIRNEHGAGRHQKQDQAQHDINDAVLFHQNSTPIRQNV